jgi:predicted acylesterase/phospholipase RssA
VAEASHKRIEIGVVLQGGGALGAYECGGMVALLELIEETKSAGRAVALKAISGVSIGAINAGCIVGAADSADARRRIGALWDDLTLPAPPFWPAAAQRDLSLFGLPGFYWPRGDLANVAQWTSYYDTGSLKATLEKHIDFTALNANAVVLVVSAVDVESGELKRFSNRGIEGNPPVEGPIGPEHIMASGSLPPQFPWTEIKGRRYWDGGLIDNAPLGDTIDAFSRGDDVLRLLVVMDVYPLAARRPRRMTDVADRMHELSFGNRLRQDSERAWRINEFLRTIDELAALVPPDALPDDLEVRIAWARQFKSLQVVDIDMQNPSVDGKAPAQDSSDGEYGLRDFSPATVQRRREIGYRVTRARLAAVLAGAGAGAA